MKTDRRCKSIPSLWRSKHPASKSLRPPEHHAGHSIRTKRTHSNPAKHSSQSNWSWKPRRQGIVAVLRKEPVRFDRLRFRSFRKFICSVRFGSVWFGKPNLPVRIGWACVFRTRRSSVWSGSVRFGSPSASGRFRNYTVRFSSVRPVRFGFLEYIYIYI